LHFWRFFILDLSFHALENLPVRIKVIKQFFGDYSFFEMALDLGEALRTVAAAIAAASGVPSATSGEWDLYSSFPDFRRVLSTEHADIGHLLERLMAWNGLLRGGRFPCGPHDLAELLTEANDVLLERVASSLDEAAGLRKMEKQVLLKVSKPVSSASSAASTSASGSWNRQPAKEDQPSSSSANGDKNVYATLSTSHTIRRPQLSFRDLIDNSKNTFLPRITEKPHSKKPLSILPEYDEQNRIISYTHPYQVELDTFRPTEWQLRPPDKDELEPPLSVEEASFAFIETPTALARMVDMLKKEDVVAFDLEAHWLRSYQVSYTSTFCSFIP